jgi:hypothetical protein
MPVFLVVADKVGRTNTILPFLTLAGILLFIFPLCTSVSKPVGATIVIMILTTFLCRRCCYLNTARWSHTIRNSLRLCIGRSRLSPTSRRRSTWSNGIGRRASWEYDCIPSAWICMSAFCGSDPRRRSRNWLSLVGRMCV